VQQNKDGVQKLFKQFGLFSLAVILSSSLLTASFEDFKRSQADVFQKYKDENDAAFNRFLKAQWKAYNVHKGVKVYEEPKPKKIPKVKLVEARKVGPKVNMIIPKISKKKNDEPKTVKKLIILEKTTVTKKTDINFDFFGTSIGLNVSKGIKNANFYPTNQKGIANYFDKVATSEYDELLADIESIKKDLKLNDWGLYLLVEKLSKEVYSNDDNSKLLAWFIFNKLGYAVKVGLANKHIVMLHYSEKIIYSTPNYNFGKNKFYVVSNYAKGKVGRLFSYEQNYPGSDKPLDLSLNNLPLFAKNTKSKELSFSEFGNDFKVSITYNQNLLDFMATYPQADYDTFFNAPMDKETFNQLAKAIKKHVDGKKMSEALNFVLHFVQKSFKYQMDDEQFGHEKVMFAQETLYFDKSDCEDRAVLFSRLVDKLFGIGVIGVKYSDHMATGLYIPMEGDSVKAGTKRFVIADPTYVNSTIGQSMPKYKPKKPESFIVIKR
jgi:hypothetical protein